MDRVELSRVLTIKNRQEGILEIVGRMKVVLEFFKRNQKYKNLVPFLKTYYLITKSVAERRLERKRYFQDTDALDALDVYFADLYLKPLKAYLLQGKKLSPWRVYFEYCEKKRGIPFVQMLLGINAHINADLLTASVKLKYSNRQDFQTINKILKEEIPDVMKFLVKVDHDIYGLGALIFRKFALTEFKHVIVNWREDVWRHAKSLPSGKYSRAKGKILRQTEQIGTDIINVFENIRHLRAPTKLISQMNALKVRL